MTRIHRVPMVRQLISPDEWEKHDGPSLGDRMEWSNRACGMAALRMVLLAYGKDAPTVTELLHQGVAAGALVDRGWVHAGLADLAHKHGLPARAVPVTADTLPDLLASRPLIVSVTETLPTDGRKGGHLVVARGVHTEAGELHLLFRDPSAWGQEHESVPLARFTASYTGRAIAFPPLGRTIAVLGEMAELGDASVDAHRQVGQMAAEQGVDILVAVGDKLAKQLALAAASAGVPDVAIVGDNQTATAYVDQLLRPGDVVLTKASRSGMLWQVAQALTGKPVTGL